MNDRFENAPTLGILPGLVNVAGKRKLKPATRKHQ